MFLRPIGLIFASIFYQAQVNGQWKSIKHSKLVLAHIPNHDKLDHSIRRSQLVQAHIPDRDKWDHINCLSNVKEI